MAFDLQSRYENMSDVEPHSFLPRVVGRKALPSCGAQRWRDGPRARRRAAPSGVARVWGGELRRNSNSGRGLV